MDHITDANLTTFHQIRQQHALPDFVKSAVIDKEAIDKLPGYAFADPAHRQFPCHTRSDTYLSYAYFLKNANDIPQEHRTAIYNNLRKFAHDWAIHTECEALTREHEQAVNQDLTKLADDNFAIVETWNGEKYRALPLLNAECVKQATEHLNQYRDRYPYQWRQRAAQRILAKAAEFGAKPEDDYLYKAAGTYAGLKTDVAQKLLDRAYLVNRKHHGEDEQLALVKLAQGVANSNGDLDWTKVAAIVDAYDEHYNLKRLYARGLQTPEELVSNLDKGEVKQAAESLIRLTNGQVYQKSAIASAGLEPYTVLGDDLVNELRDGLQDVDIEKAAAILPTLPKPDADVLDRAFRAAGVSSAAAACKSAGLGSNVSEWSREDWDSVVDTLRG